MHILYNINRALNINYAIALLIQKFFYLGVQLLIVYFFFYFFADIMHGGTI